MNILSFHKFWLRLQGGLSFLLSTLLTLISTIITVTMFVIGDILPDKKDLSTLVSWFFSEEDTLAKALVAIVVLVACIEIYRKYRTKQKDKDVSTVLVTQHRLLVEDLLESLFSRLQYSEKERISVYVETKKCFVLLGRYSLNSSYRTSKFGLYPKGSGCISEAWNRGFAEDLSMPKKPEAWEQHQTTKWHLPNGTPKRKNMRPRSIYALRLEDRRKNNTPIGVIVFESLDPSKCVKDKIFPDFKGEVQVGLEKLLQLLSDVNVEDYIIRNADGGL